LTIAATCPLVDSTNRWRPVGESQHDAELALRASHWLGSSVLQPTR